MDNNEEFLVQLSSPERMYSKYYHDFIESQLLTYTEKIVFLALKRFLNVQKENGEVFPSIERICSMLQMSKPTVISSINNLIKKGVVKKIRQGLTKTNIYIINDNASIWKCNSEEEVSELLKNEPHTLLSADEHIAALRKLGYRVNVSELKDDVPVPDDSSKQMEKYSHEQIRIFFDYDVLITNVRPEMVDNIMSILYDILNTTKKTIRIGKEDKPANVVIGKLMKLSHMDIEYVIEQYSKVNTRVSHPIPYIITLLYYAKEQSDLDISNQVMQEFNT